MNTINTHFFNTSAEAYDACQCDINIKDGDILLIPSEGVVGIAHTWPVAVSQKAGALHVPSADYTLAEVFDLMDINANVLHYAKHFANVYAI